MGMYDFAAADKVLNEKLGVLAVRALLFCDARASDRSRAHTARRPRSFSTSRPYYDARARHARAACGVASAERRPLTVTLFVFGRRVLGLLVLCWRRASPCRWIRRT